MFISNAFIGNAYEMNGNYVLYKPLALIESSGEFVDGIGIVVERVADEMLGPKSVEVWERRERTRIITEKKEV